MASVGWMCLLLAIPAYGAGWFSFSSTEGGYQILFPQKPQKQTAVHKSIVGDIGENTYSAPGGTGTEYSVEYSNLPGIAVTFGGDGGIMDKAKKGLLQDCQGQEQSFSDTSLQGFPGKELEYRFTGGDGKTQYGKARFYMVKKRLFVLVATSPKPNPSNWGKFFNSFTLVNP